MPRGAAKINNAKINLYFPFGVEFHEIKKKQKTKKAELKLCGASDSRENSTDTSGRSEGRQDLGRHDGLRGRMGSRGSRYRGHQETQVRPDAVDIETRVHRVLASGLQEHMHDTGSREKRLSGSIL